MAYVPGTLSIAAWSSPVTVVGNDFITNLDETFNDVVTNNAASLVNYINNEMAKIPNYLSNEFTIIYTGVEANANIASSAATAAALSETNAAASAATASTAATNAGNSATAAAASAATASSAATSATASASTASTAATAASGSATAAAASATAAAASQAAASASETAAGSSATAAAASQSAAAASATAAGLSQTAAAASETNANSSATSAASSASSASSSATSATASKNAAATSETNAAGSATAASGSASAADTSATSSAQSATTAQLKAWISEAEQMTAASYAEEPVDVEVKVYTSDGDGTFTPTTQTGVYSALHHRTKGLAQDASTKLPKDGSEPMTGNLEAPSMSIGGDYLSPFGFKNFLINGNFAIWQRGTSQTTSGYGSDDRWANGNLGSTKTHSRQTATDIERVLFNSNYFSRTVVSSVLGTTNYVLKEQRIGNVTDLAGKTVTLSFWAKADAPKNIAICLEQYFGTGGTPSSPVQGIGAQLVALTNTWAKYEVNITLPTIVGKTLGTDGLHNTYTRVMIWLDAGATHDARTASLGQQSGTFDIAEVQLEEGSVATPFEQRLFALEFDLCCRYYQEMKEGARLGSTVNGHYYYASFPLAKPMRVKPTTTYTSTQQASTWSFITSASEIDSVRVYAMCDSGATNNSSVIYFQNYKFDAEL